MNLCEKVFDQNNDSGLTLLNNYLCLPIEYINSKLLREIVIDSKDVINVRRRGILPSECLMELILRDMKYFDLLIIFVEYGSTLCFKKLYDLLDKIHKLISINEMHLLLVKLVENFDVEWEPRLFYIDFIVRAEPEMIKVLSTVMYEKESAHSAFFLALNYFTKNTYSDALLKKTVSRIGFLLKINDLTLDYEEHGQSFLHYLIINHSDSTKEHINILDNILKSGLLSINVRDNKGCMPLYYVNGRQIILNYYLKALVINNLYGIRYNSINDSGNYNLLNILKTIVNCDIYCGYSLVYAQHINSYIDSYINMSFSEMMSLN